MSGNPVCSRCSNQVQSSWKYCRFCGNKLEFAEKKVAEPVTQGADLKIEEPEPKEELSEEYSFDKKLYYRVLSTRAERSVIMKRKEEIRGEIDSLIEQLQAGLVGKDHVLPKVKELKEEVKKINDENKSYSNIPDELPVEILNDQIIAAKQRLRKIDLLKSDDNLSKDTIREAKSRTEKSLELLRDQQSKIFGHLRSWKDQLKSDIEEVRKDIELLYVRVKTEEITEETYKDKKEKLVKSIQNDEEVLASLEQILAN